MTVVLTEFIRESNAIEGLRHDPMDAEVEAYERFLALKNVARVDLSAFVLTVTQGARLRAEKGMNVRVGDHFPIPGGPDIVRKLDHLLVRVHNDDPCPWRMHVEYETLHPFMDGNGRSGRVLWLWMMRRQGRDRGLGFLHEFYYQTLSEVGR